MLIAPEQQRLDFDDAQSAVERGLQVVRATFRSVEPFDWSLFDGFDSLRVLTYSASILGYRADARPALLRAFRVRLRL